MEELLYLILELLFFWKKDDQEKVKPNDKEVEFDTLKEGKKIIVVGKVAESTYYSFINGEKYLLKEFNNQILVTNEKVTINKIEGKNLIVEKI